MAVRKINNHWYVDIRWNGDRHRKRSLVDSKAGAKAYELSVCNRLTRGESINEHRDNPEKRQRYKDFAWKWFDLYVKNGKKKHSVVSSYKYILKTNLVPYFGKTPINRITTLQVEEYVAKKKKAGRANRTVNNHLMVLSKSLKCARDWYGIDKLPKIEWLKKPPIKNDFLSEDECDQLLNSAKGVWREMILLALKTGMRLGEIRALRWEDINWTTRILTVQRSYCRGIIESPKSNRSRYIPLHEDVSAMLEKRKQEKGYIFTDSQGRILPSGNLYRGLRRCCQGAGVRRIGWHLFRHTFASNLAMASAPMRAIQELLGHADIQTTMRYAHLSPSALASTINLLGSHKQNTDFGPYMGNAPIYVKSGNKQCELKLPNLKQNNLE